MFFSRSRYNWVIKDFVNWVFPVPIVPMIPVFVWNNISVLFGSQITSEPSCWLSPNRTFIPSDFDSGTSSFSLFSWACASSSCLFSEEVSWWLSFSFSAGSSLVPSDDDSPNSVAVIPVISPVRFSTLHSWNNKRSLFRVFWISSWISSTLLKIRSNSSFSGISIKLIVSSLKDVFLDVNDCLKDKTEPRPSISWMSVEII